MKHYLRFILVLLLSTVWCVGGYSQETVTDELTYSVLGLTGNSYTKFSGKKATSDAAYSGYAYKKNSNIQIKTSQQKGNYTGIVSSVSGGKIKRIEISGVGSGNSIDVYCSNNVYSSADDLFSSKAGTKVGTIKSSNSRLEISDDYSYVGIRSNSGVVSMSKITIVWEKESSKTPTTTTFGTNVDNKTFTITEGETFPTHVATMTTEGVAGTIKYASDNAAVNVDQNGVTSAGTGFGKAKITATFTPTDAETYASSSAYYYIDYKEKTKPATAISFDKSNVTLTTLDYASFTGQTATLKAGEAILTNELTYSKEDAAGVITTLNNDGTLVLSGKEGTATVIAKFAGSDEYASSSESYTITVRKVYGNIAELKKVLTTTAKEYSLNLKDAVVTGIYDNKDKNGNFNVYIEDASAGILIFYPNANNDFKVGQKINGEVTIKGTTYNRLPEITSWTATESCTVIDGADVPLTTVTIAELSANFDKYESRRVKIENATVTTGTATDNESGKIAQGESEMTLRTKAVAVTTTKDDVIDVIGYPATYRSYQQFSVWSQDDIIVKSSVVKTTLSFDPATKEYNVDNNNKEAFTAPTATVKDAEGNIVEGAAITYTSSDPSVATVGETDGTVTFVGFGTTVITASYAGDATHMASSSSYTINYGKVKTTMSWSATEVTANLGEKFTAPTLSLTADNVSILEGKTIKYTSTDENVAIVDENGTVVLMDKEGTTTITATFAGDETYAEASASYTLTVKDPNKLEVTFDFVNNKYGYGIAQVPVGAKFKSEDVTITHVKNGTQNKTAFYGDSFRVYYGSQLNISVAAGYYMTKIVFDNIKDNTFSCTPGTLNGNVWEGTASSIDLDVNGTNQFKTITVSYAKCPEVVVDENATQDDMLNLIIKNSNKVVNAKLNRTLIADGGWYTFSVPFDVKDVNSTALSGAEIRKYKSMNGSIMEFEATTELKAGHAYLVKPSVDITTPIFNSVTLSEGDNLKDGVNGYEFIATLGSTELKTNGTNLFLGADNKFYIPTETGKIMKALRGYFVAPSGESGSKMGINIDGETNYISTLNGSAVVYGKVYNLNGQYVGNDVKSLKKGVYVVNGRKFIVK